MMCARERISIRHVNIIKNMYNGAITNVRSSCCSSTDSPITIELYQGCSVMDELTIYIQDVFNVYYSLVHKISR